MIDWTNLGPLPLRRQRDLNDRERLAGAAHRKRCAKHKGRNHWRNWERRQMALAKKKAAAIKSGQASAAAERYHAAVRAFWTGATEVHP